MSGHAQMFGENAGFEESYLEKTSSPLEKSFIAVVIRLSPV